MDNLNLGRHISGQFNVDLENVRNKVLQMGGLVEKQLADALTAVVKGDVELARLVVSTDQQVNRLDVQIDEEVTQIIAKRQPAASDLRLMVSITKIITDLERIGDTAKKVAAIIVSGDASQHSPLLTRLEAMGRHVSQMLHDVLDAFARLDIDAALVVHREDAKVDLEYEGLFREMTTYMMEDPRSIPKVLEVVGAVRSLERIGDRCQNIAEYIVYMVKGKIIRHVHGEELEALLR